MSELATAAARGDLNRVRSIVNRGAFIDSRTTNGWTALHHAVFNQMEHVVRFLVEKQANCNISNNEGHKPLHIASMKPDVVIVLLLIEGQATINPKDRVFHFFLEFLLLSRSSSFSSQNPSSLCLRKWPHTNRHFSLSIWCRCKRN
jgi:ankyrin repeat protein